MDILEKVSQQRWVLRRAREEKRSSLNNWYTIGNKISSNESGALRCCGAEPENTGDERAMLAEQTGPGKGHDFAWEVKKSATAAAQLGERAEELEQKRHWVRKQPRLLSWEMQWENWVHRTKPRRSRWCCAALWASGWWRVKNFGEWGEQSGFWSKDHDISYCLWTVTDELWRVKLWQIKSSLPAVPPAMGYCRE